MIDNNEALKALAGILTSSNAEAINRSNTIVGKTRGDSEYENNSPIPKKDIESFMMQSHDFNEDRTPSMEDMERARAEANSAGQPFSSFIPQPVQQQFQQQYPYGQMPPPSYQPPSMSQQDIATIHSTFNMLKETRVGLPNTLKMIYDREGEILNETKKIDSALSYILEILTNLVNEKDGKKDKTFRKEITSEDNVKNNESSIEKIDGKVDEYPAIYN